ncbi:MAG: pyridoxal phosphate-dependent decarboxylase family protein [Streptosporangiaceae bacterium]
MDLHRWLSAGLAAIGDWQAGFPAFEQHPSLLVSDERFAVAFGELTDRLRDNYPFFHPSYAGQMLKPPHPAAVAGYLTTMLVNPNNHALDGGPATAALEKDVIAQLAAMLGMGEHLGHLTTSGTIANLEALFIARELHPGKGIAYSSEAHYTHSRMCGVLGIQGTAVGVDTAGRMDLDELDALLAGGQVGTVVATVGTTGLGAIDPVHGILAAARRHGVRVHVDAAYGGFYALLADLDGAAGLDPAGLDPAPWRAIAACDSVVIDPHKHGLQPYGCGAVLFADPDVGRFYLHDSPYTYFTSGDLHLGEISLECSRAGAAAAALWLTFRLLPLTPDGLGQVLAACRRAALAWSRMLTDSLRLDLYQPPDLDIVCYFPVTADRSLAAIDQASGRFLTEGMTAARDPLFVSTLRVSARDLISRHPAVQPDADGARIIRSVLMKPESQTYITGLHARAETMACRLATPLCGGAQAGDQAGRGAAPESGVSAQPEDPGDLGGCLALMLGDIGPAVSQGDDAVGRCGVVSPDVAPAQVCRMGGPAVQFHGKGVLLVEHVSVNRASALPGPDLPGPARQHVRALDTAHVVILQAGVHASPVSRHGLDELAPPTQFGPRCDRVVQPGLRGQPPSQSTGDPAARIVGGHCRPGQVEHRFLDPRPPQRQHRVKRLVSPAGPVHGDSGNAHDMPVARDREVDDRALPVGQPGQLSSRVIAQHRVRTHSQHCCPQDRGSARRARKDSVDAGLQPLPSLPR